MLPKRSDPGKRFGSLIDEALAKSNVGVASGTLIRWGRSTAAASSRVPVAPSACQAAFCNVLLEGASSRASSTASFRRYKLGL